MRWKMSALHFQMCRFAHFVQEEGVIILLVGVDPECSNKLIKIFLHSFPLKNLVSFFYISYMNFRFCNMQSSS